MRRADPQPYLGLLLSEYPEKNGSIVKEMARRLISSEESKEKLIGQIQARLTNPSQSLDQQVNESLRTFPFE